MAVRACSIFLSPGYFGGMAAMAALLSLGLLSWARSVVLRWLAVVSALAAVGGLLASGSRAPMVGLIVGLVAMTLVSRRRGMVTVGIIIVALGSVYLLRDMVGAGAGRIERQLTVALALQRSLQPLGFGLEAALDHPLGRGIATGQGAGRLVHSGAITAEASEGARFIENEFGRALAELGFPGTALWMWMVLTPLVGTYRAVRKLGSQRAGVLAAALFGAMIASFVQLGVGSALYQGAGMYYYLFAAMAQRLTELPVVAVETVPAPSPLRRHGFVYERR
jgi:O-antigen ligase